MTEDQLKNQILNVLIDNQRQNDRWLLAALDRLGITLSKEQLWSLCRQLRQEDRLEVIEIDDMGVEKLSVRKSQKIPQYIPDTDLP